MLLIWPNTSPTPPEYYLNESSNMAIHTLCFNYSKEGWRYCNWILPVKVHILYFCWSQWHSQLCRECYLPKYYYSWGPSYIVAQQIWPILISKFHKIYVYSFTDSLICVVGVNKYITVLKVLVGWDLFRGFTTPGQENSFYSTSRLWDALHLRGFLGIV